LIQRRENSAAAQEEESPGAGQEDKDARQQQEGQEIPAQGTVRDCVVFFARATNSYSFLPEKVDRAI
jgi:hypothetical protein